MFDKILYINLRHRIDRKNNVIEQLKKINALEKAERIDAIYGVELDIPNISSSLITDKGIADALNDHKEVYTYLTKGGIGCALSHRKAYETILKEGLKSALILEDDVTIDDLFNEKLQHTLNHMPEYDVLFLGYHDTSEKYFEPQTNDYYVKPNKLFGLFGYIVTNSGAKKLLDVFPITEQIDSEIPRHFDKINAYAVPPNNKLIYSDQSSVFTKFGTDIQIREQFDKLLHIRLIMLAFILAIAIALICLVF